jgi:Asp-tRNA(Asn)/Glu-tRNA(Gln) amidotransferase A subunit family amidase
MTVELSGADNVFEKACMTDVIYSSVVTLAHAIRSNHVSSVEVVEAYLRRIEAVNPKLNAIVQLSQTARAEAQAADNALAREPES